MAVKDRTNQTGGTGAWRDLEAARRGCRGGARPPGVGGGLLRERQRVDGVRPGRRGPQSGTALERHRRQLRDGLALEAGEGVYGTTSTNDVPVTMADGTVLRANVIYPTDAKTGKVAKGPFPVLLTQTPYGKGSGGSSTPGSAQNASAGAATGGALDRTPTAASYIELNLQPAR